MFKIIYEIPNSIHIIGQIKFILKVLHLNTTNRNFVSLIEGAISINALILWNEHISDAVNFEKANTHYDMTNIVRQF